MSILIQIKTKGRLLGSGGGVVVGLKPIKGHVAGKRYCVFVVLRDDEVLDSDRFNFAN